MVKKDNAPAKSEKAKVEKQVKKKPDKVTKPDKQPKQPKQPKQNKDKRGNKVEQELSQLAKDLGIRVSSPYGYYPEDVDPIIKNLQKAVSDLEKENKRLADDAHDAKEKLKISNSELNQLRMQVSLMEVPDVSAEEGFAMLSRIDSITGQYNSESVVDIKKAQQTTQNIQSGTTPKLKINIKPKQN